MQTDGTRRGHAAGRLPVTRAVPRGSGARTVIESLRADILGLVLPPGADLEEAGLVRDYGLSRTPVREALNQLAAEGLVQLVPNRGARVAALPLDQVPELLETLELYQRATTRLAAARRQEDDLARLTGINRDFAAAAAQADLAGMAETNRRFHGVIADAAGNRVLAADTHAIERRTLRLARAAFGQAQGIAAGAEDFGYSVTQHEAMIAALRARDAESADALIRLHCAVFRRRIAAFITASAAAGIPLDAPAVLAATGTADP
jgi:DNA-binding GntR family transcriptional regulator